MLRPAACLFDLDGLLLDTEPLHGRAWSEAGLAFGVQLSEGQLLGLRGRRRLDNARQVIAWIEAEGVKPPSTEELLAVQQPIARHLLPMAEPMEGAPELLARCQDLAIPMALVTSSTSSSVALKSAPHPWLELLETRVYGDDPDLGSGKPAPDAFQLAALRLGHNPIDCWAFEDSQAGTLAALAAGCRVHVLLPAGVGQENYPAAAHCLRSLRELGL
ncbi:HAD family phosphatase [Synechococcus sp. CS-602]|uniref:HAD family hydrolase n=1 Tax=Synechococcaceae TaxID=1890426 RepID=UPI0008FF512A|nr:MULTISPECIES: HAD family phosphatase [Synechococcaceae]MCT4365220.1 HAD family phosphatase [Candidatus Regnicoccus frigidus MAG-AL1]APD48584.1 HAD family hydrolase [Synechococcus sp. SynAce01]MCT0205074.1 HAD family phosphatase [Synechococcus sp. CS-602]MCT0245823.1 HAD family phosphatase [Synechococcus sp. CS-601]MCT4367329.1 HAD family phosphatase [Candidatus Regnicoccus frigidus MAG-AL2]